MTTPATLDAKAPTAASPRKPRSDKTKLVRRTPGLLQVRVLDGDVPLTGLFVIFQIDQADPLHGEVSSAYRDAWNDEALPGEPLRYALGFVDGDGYIQPVRGAHPGESPCNPWHEIYPQGKLRRLSSKVGGKLPPPAANKNPHAWQLPGEADVWVMPIRHPSPDRARAVLRALVNPDAVPPGRYRLPDDFAPLFHKCKVVTSGAALVLDLKTLEASAYWPPGPARYGGWSLYADMPHAHRPQVRDQVRALREDLGLLLYAFRGANPYGDPPGTPADVSSAFDGGVFAAVAGFQGDAQIGKAFQPDDPDDARGTLLSSMPPVWGERQPVWAYLLGAIVDAPALPPSSFEEDERWEPGVVDQRTGDAIGSWLDAGCARPFRDPRAYASEPSAPSSRFTAAEQIAGAGSLRDSILLPLHAFQPYAKGARNWFEWAVPDLVVRVTILRFLLVRLGCPYGMAVSHTFREIASPGGQGKALCSIHKTGRAVDFAVVGSVTKSDKIVDYANPIGAWPIHYEADWLGGSAGKAHAQTVLTEATRARVKNEGELKAVNEKLERLTAAAGQHPTKTQRAQHEQLETRRTELTAQRTTLERHECYAVIDLQRASNEHDETKAGQRLRWRIFGHSTWSPPPGLDGYRLLAERIGLPIGMTPLDQVDYNQPTDLEHEVVRFLQVSLGDTQRAREWLEGPRRLVRQIVATLFRRAGGSPVPVEQLPDLLDTQFGMFRTTIKPWKYQPYSKTAGSPGRPLAATHDTAASREYLNEGRREPALIPEGAVSFINISRVAAICGLHRIGAQMGSIRDPSSMAHDIDDQPAPLAIAVVEPVSRGHAPDHRNPGAIAGLCRRLLSEAHHRNDAATIERPNCMPFQVKITDLNVTMMGNWVRANVHSSKRPPLPHQPHGYAVRVEVPPKFDATAAPATKKDAQRRDLASANRQLIVKLFEGFPDLLFYVIAGPGDLAGLPADVAGDPKTGSQWAKIFASHGPEPKNGPAKPKQQTDWSVELQPCFLKQRPAGLADVPFLPDDVVTLPAPGVGRALEWWHYETAEANTTHWSKLLISVGYDRAALIAPVVPPPTDRPFAINGRGLGFVTTKRSTTPDVTRGGAQAPEVDGTPVENGS